MIDWSRSQTTIHHFFQYLKGEDGRDGRDGRDGADGSSGSTPVIINGYWWVDGKNTGIEATGADGIKGEKGDKGDDGNTPDVEIRNGTWWIDGVDTGISATGPQGEPGNNAIEIDPNSISPHIGKNGNWYIGVTDTGIPATGPKGDDGLSAYQLWLNDLNKGNIRDKAGDPWPAKENTIADFYRYLTGADGAAGKTGADGKSAFDLWVEMVTSPSGLYDPKDSSKKWPIGDITEAHFFKFLAGKDGADGKNGAPGKDGKCAYDLWKADLEDRAGTKDPLLNHRTDAPWDPDRDTMEDFYDYLRGADGKDGKQGADGADGETIEVIAGVPNVIAQYCDAINGEYVRPTDGGVAYLVYDKYGVLAPNATVKGLPGVKDPSKVYTANADGEFIVPREDLPANGTDAVRTGSASVTIDGETETPSANNTFVPKSMQVRIVYASVAKIYATLKVAFKMQRKVGTDGAWEDFPTHLPTEKIKLTALYISDTNDPQSYKHGNKLTQEFKELKSGGISTFELNINRPVLENRLDERNGVPYYWDKNCTHLSVKSAAKYYGVDYYWDGISLLPPVQIAPFLKSLTLYKISTAEQPYFSSIDGEFDYQDINKDHLYNISPVVSKKPCGTQLIDFNKYTGADVPDRAFFYTKFTYYTWPDNTKQESMSSKVHTTFNAPTFSVLTPYLNCTISNCYNSQYFFKTYNMGTLRYDKCKKKYYVDQGDKLPEVTVTYTDSNK